MVLPQPTRHLKNLIAGILIVLLVAPVVMLLLQFGSRHVAKEVMQERIRIGMGVEEPSIKLIPESAVTVGNWEEEGRELNLDGKLYDVVGTCVVDGHKMFRCVS